MKPTILKNVCRARLLPLLLAFLLLFPPVSSAAGSSLPSAIRVNLRRLTLTDQAWLTLEGRYLVRCASGTELLLPSSAAVTVFLRDGRLVLFYNGLSLSAGKELTFLRQQDGDAEPYIRFNLQPGFYPGDLTLSVRDGAIRPVLSLPLETYLQGVVPYEMSDSFPLEALKAQAVCARTYALSRISPSSEWDVVDTTNDQVFKGLLPENKNTARAVSETAGLVLTWKSKLITAWYSASNGGQTELPQHVWGGSGIPECFALTDDPWDLENPDSLTRTASLKKDGTGLSPAVIRLLKTALEDSSGLQDFDLSVDAPFRVDAIRKVSLTDPRYPEPSRLMTRLAVTLDLSAPLKPGRTLPQGSEEDLDIEDVLEPDRTPVPTATPAPAGADGEPLLYPAGTHTVTLDLFPETVFALGLSISGADNELITVTEDSKAFTLVSGRYGHGVGMSQRGAQYQASKGGRTFDRILDYYYPGAVIKQYQGEPASVPTPDPALAVTPGPVPTATPRPTLMPVTEALPEGAWLASVENIDDDSSLNLRARPSAASEVLMRLYRHQKLIVLENAEIEGWVRVRTDAAEGFVMQSFLQPAD